MQNEKARAKTIHKIFLCVDIVTIVLMLCIDGFILHQFYDQDGGINIRDISAIFLFPSVLKVISSLLLALSACYIARWVRKSTGKN